MRPPVRSTRSMSSVPQLLAFSSESQTVPAHESRTDAKPVPTTEKKMRHRMTDEQLLRLEEVFRSAQYPTRDEKRDLAESLGMDFKTVTIWYQNRRQTNKKRASSASPRPSAVNMRRHSSSSGLARASPASMNNTLRDNYHQQSVSHGSHLAPSKAHKSRTALRVDPADLWEHLLSSPPEADTSPILGSDAFEEIGGDNAWTLERACAKERDEKKRRLLVEKHSAMDVDVVTVSDDEETELEGLDDEDVTSDLSSSTSTTPSIITRIHVPQIDIPTEVKAAYDEDIVEGAGLLLGFMHSKKIMIIRRSSFAGVDDA